MSGVFPARASQGLSVLWGEGDSGRPDLLPAHSLDDDNDASLVGAAHAMFPRTLAQSHRK